MYTKRQTFNLSSRTCKCPHLRVLLGAWALYPWQFLTVRLLWISKQPLGWTVVGCEGSKVWRQLGMAWMNWWSTWINSNFLVYFVYLVLLYSNISNSPGLVEQVPPKHCFCNYWRDLIRVWMDNCCRSGAPSRPPETSLSTRLNDLSVFISFESHALPDMCCN